MSGKILIVDDEPDSVSFLESVLEENGYDYLSAGDGVEGLELARAEKPILILLDLIMPEKSGIMMFQELKTDPEMRKIPVIVVSGISRITGVDFKEFVIKQPNKDGSEQVGTTGEGRYTKPDAFMEKPIKPDELVAKIREILEG
ncbi:MAG: response regulator [Deltaproteobacteria bacterium]|nr:response regulator [Deltaproteobacteria bacterium]MBW2353173.1 response regulator [Deltaproteobacteria bacterium]HDZ89231.1 response regulator [Deltaproteobacteria bacterium]